MTIRPVTPAEHEALGEITVAAYGTIEGHTVSEHYGALLRDVAARVANAEVLVAVDDDGALLGGVTYVGDAASSLAEFDGADESGMRMLAVDPTRQGGGVGRALVEACIGCARRDGKHALILYTTAAMTAAHHLYERFGFQRRPGRDMIVESGLELRSYVLDL